MLTCTRFKESAKRVKTLFFIYIHTCACSIFCDKWQEETPSVMLRGDSLCFGVSRQTIENVTTDVQVERIARRPVPAVSYTHLTLPTNHRV